ncbi:MAG: Pre-mRNA-splicing factor rse1, partial [Watsoniomyces obsoletus]
MKSAPFLIALALTTSCAPRAPDIAVSDAWARATAPGQSSGAVYATIANRGAADMLVGVGSPAGSAMLHRSDNEGGIARMRMLSSVEIPVRETVVLAPGATHIMLTGLAAPLAAGSAFPITFQFAQSGPRTVTVAIRLILWGLVALAAAALVFLLARPAPELPAPSTTELPLASIGGPFTLVGADAKPFASTRLAGKPFAIFFGELYPPTTAEGLNTGINHEHHGSNGYQNGESQEYGRLAPERARK